MYNHNESDRLRTQIDEPTPTYHQDYTITISDETINYLSRRFPGGIDVSPSVDKLLQNPENSSLRNETIYPRWFRKK